MTLVTIVNRSYDELLTEFSLRVNGPRTLPGDPDNSFIVRKLDGRLGPGEGTPMPRGRPRLPDSLIEAVRAWVEVGAPKDESILGVPAVP